MKKILYFIKGPVPSEKETAEAKLLGAVFRNASATGPSDSVETCDAVAGAVPEAYAGYPKADGQGDGKKPLERMNNAELDAKAAELDLTFPETVKTKAEKAAYIAEYLASKTDGQGDGHEGNGAPGAPATPGADQ